MVALKKPRYLLLAQMISSAYIEDFFFCMGGNTKFQILRAGLPINEPLFASAQIGPLPLVERRTNAPIAHSALAHKLARAAFYIMRDGVPFMPEKAFA